jgi:hypothetical protein
MRLLPIRPILFAVAAFAAVLIYLIWWVTYAGIHYNPRYSVRPPGVSVEVQGTSVRLLSLIRADQLSNSGGGQPAIPEPGAVWVVAALEAVRHDPGKEFGCETKLLGPERRIWATESFHVKRATEDCERENPVGKAVRFESIFMVPARYADQLIGIALVDSSTTARTPVLRPPAP